MNLIKRSYQTAVILVFAFSAASSFGWEQSLYASGLRQIIDLDGTWELAEGDMNLIPERFAFVHSVPVPGLVDMAKPSLREIGTKSDLREAFWYRKIFIIDGPVPEVAVLKINKAKYGTRVFINGKLIGDHLANFTPGLFNLSAHLQGNGASNELLVRIGASLDSVPETIPVGKDFEKLRYIPGIYDSVQVIMSGTPHIIRIQTVPDIEKKAVRIVAEVGNTGKAGKIRLACVVREVLSRKVAGSSKSLNINIGPNEIKTIDMQIPIDDCRLWSPEDPFLYELEASTGFDTEQVCFGMRSFRFDPTTGRAVLNGKPYYLRGTNVCILRFFEEPTRTDQPWREEWIRRLHRKFRSMNWNIVRYCIGFPPDIWYDIADEEGLLIQDEYPFWRGASMPEAYTTEQIIKEYTEWMQQRWNHPCVVIWDAANETYTPKTGEAIAAVRGLDLSDRPWENGWSEPQRSDDPAEDHPYPFLSIFTLADMAHVSPIPSSYLIPGVPPIKTARSHIINEYGWFWLNRDGTPTRMTEDIFKRLAGENATVDQRRQTAARNIAALTEFWRSHRSSAAVMHILGLGHSIPVKGATCDNFLDIEALTFEPYYEKYVRDAFSPVGLMINSWTYTYVLEDLGQGEIAIPVAIINDLYEDWTGQVELKITDDQNQTLFEQTKPLKVQTLGREEIVFHPKMPSEIGRYQFVAQLRTGGDTDVQSLRDFEIITSQEHEARLGLAFGKSVVASSVATIDGVRYSPENAVDGQYMSWWSSDASDPQWLAVDLGEMTKISRVTLALKANHDPAEYKIQVSDNGRDWIDVFYSNSRAWHIKKIEFEPVAARWVRFLGIKRPSRHPYSLCEFRVFP